MSYRKQIVIAQIDNGYLLSFIEQKQDQGQPPSQRTIEKYVASLDEANREVQALSSNLLVATAVPTRAIEVG